MTYSDKEISIIFDQRDMGIQAIGLSFWSPDGIVRTAVKCEVVKCEADRDQAITEHLPTLLRALADKMDRK